ncbi:MAG TPA: class I adenylate-forming enzyme family protein, partial [Kouleothrix sp.]|nr:class I adenylate-forming enzyme family protein [Kouleothrix sp.]
MYIGDWLARRAHLSPHKVALRDAVTSNALQPITYAEWNRAANRTAQLLRERFRVRPGDRVAVLALNCVEYLDIWFACGKLGAILQNLNWRLTVAELRALVEDAAPQVLIYGPEFAEQAAALLETPGVPHLVALDGTARAHPADVLFAERAELPDMPPPPVELSWDDPWVICYT